MEKNKRTAFSILVVIFMAFSVTGFASDIPGISIFADAEFGAQKVLHHTIQIGETGTDFDYVNQGGQEILFPFQRFSAGLDIGNNHRIQFLYQPLTVVTNVTFREEVTIDGTTFPDGSPMEITYGFPFYRFSYWYLFSGIDGLDLGVGASIQLRNASIRFQSLDPQSVVGQPSLTVSQNLGIVPALNLYGGYTFASGLKIEADVVGIYASSQFINGANFEFTGSLLDAALKVGIPAWERAHPYLAIRFLGGTAEGTSEFDQTAWGNSLSTYTKNNLATLTVSLGAQIR